MLCYNLKYFTRPVTKIIVHFYIDFTSWLIKKIWLFPYPYGFCNPVRIHGKIINDMTWYDTLSQKIIHGAVNCFKTLTQMHSSASQTEMTNRLLDGMIWIFFFCLLLKFSYIPQCSSTLTFWSLTTYTYVVLQR